MQRDETTNAPAAAPADYAGSISNGHDIDGKPFVPGINCYECGRFVGRDGSISIGTFEMSNEVAYVEGICGRCLRVAA